MATQCLTVLAIISLGSIVTDNDVLMTHEEATNECRANGWEICYFESQKEVEENVPHNDFGYWTSLTDFGKPIGRVWASETAKHVLWTPNNVNEEFIVGEFAQVRNHKFTTATQFTENGEGLGYLCCTTSSCIDNNNEQRSFVTQAITEDDSNPPKQTNLIYGGSTFSRWQVGVPLELPIAQMHPSRDSWYSPLKVGLLYYNNFQGGGDFRPEPGSVAHNVTLVQVRTKCYISRLAMTSNPSDILNFGTSSISIIMRVNAVKNNFMTVVSETNETFLYFNIKDNGFNFKLDNTLECHIGMNTWHFPHVHTVIVLINRLGSDTVVTIITHSKVTNFKQTKTCTYNNYQKPIRAYQLKVGTGDVCQASNADVTALGLWNKLLSQTEIDHIRTTYETTNSAAQFNSDIFSFPRMQLSAGVPQEITGLLWFNYDEYPHYAELTRNTPIKNSFNGNDSFNFDYSDIETVFGAVQGNALALADDLSQFNVSGCPTSSGFSSPTTILISLNSSSYISSFRIYINSASTFPFDTNVTLCSSAACIDSESVLISSSSCIAEHILSEPLSYRVTHLSFSIKATEEIHAVVVEDWKQSNKLGMWPLRYSSNQLVDLSSSDNNLKERGSNSSVMVSDGGELWLQLPTNCYLRTTNRLSLPTKTWEISICVDVKVNSGTGSLLSMTDLFEFDISELIALNATESTVCLSREKYFISITVDGSEIDRTAINMTYIDSRYLVIGRSSNDITVRNIVIYSHSLTEIQSAAHFNSTMTSNSTFLSNFEAARYSYSPRLETQKSNSAIHSGEEASWYTNHSNGELFWCSKNTSSPLQTCNDQSTSSYFPCAYHEQEGTAYGSFAIYGSGEITLIIGTTSLIKHSIMVSFNGAYVLRNPTDDFEEKVTLISSEWNIIKISSYLPTSLSTCEGYSVQVLSSSNKEIQWSYINPTRDDLEVRDVPIVVESYNCGDNMTIDVEGATSVSGTGSVKSFMASSGFIAKLTYRESCNNAVISIRTNVSDLNDQETIEANLIIDAAPLVTVVGIGGIVYVEDRVTLKLEAQNMFGITDQTFSESANFSLLSSALSGWSSISSEHARMVPHPNTTDFSKGVLSIDFFFPIRDATLLPATVDVTVHVPRATNSPLTLTYTVSKHVCTPTYCNGHGSCDEIYGCLCFQNTATDGHWDSESRCGDCLPGYYGFSCGPQCPGVFRNNVNDIMVCNGHGVCDDGKSGSGTCACEENWSPDSGCGDCTPNYFGQSCSYECEVCGVPSNICNSGIRGTGSCICKNEGQEGDTCTSCKMGYASSSNSSGLCDIACPNLCNFRGKCESDGTCTCFNGYGGISCQSTCKFFNGLLCSGPNRGICDEQCDCLPNFFGDDCSECAPGRYGSNCQNTCTTQMIPPTNRQVHCSGHGKCSTGDTCTCDTFYSGDICQHICPAMVGDALPCSGSGQCNSQGLCDCLPNIEGEFCETCKPGFVGPTCTATCPSACDSHGTCVWDDAINDVVCFCSAGYCSVGADKKDCRNRNCNGCNSFEKSFRGICTPCDCAVTRAGICNPETGKCTCNINSFGTECLPCTANCKNGTCDSLNTCQCRLGYWGPTCSNVCTCSDVNFCNPTTGECECKQIGEYAMTGIGCHVTCAGVSPNGGCNGHGECGLSGACDCVRGWGGLECEIPCLHGRVENKVCVCDEYWDGARCDRTNSCTGNNATQCSRHGVCTSTGLCQCFSDEYNGFWTGMTCDSCAKGHRGLFCNYLNGPTTILTSIVTNSSSLFSASVLHTTYSSMVAGKSQVDVIAGGGSSLVKLGNPFLPSDPVGELNIGSLKIPGVVCGILFVHIFESTSYVIQTCNTTTGNQLRMSKCSWSSQAIGTCTTNTGFSNLVFTEAVANEKSIFVLVGTKNIVAFYDGFLTSQINDAVHELELVRSMAVSSTKLILGGQRRSTWDMSFLTYSVPTLSLTSDTFMKDLIEDYAPIDIGNVLCSMGTLGSWTVGAPCDKHEKYNDVTSINFNGPSEVVAAVTTNGGEVALLHVDISTYGIWHVLPVNDANVFPGNVLAMIIDEGYDQGFLSCYSTSTRKSSLYRFRVHRTALRLIGFNDISNYGSFASFIIQPTTRLLWASAPVDYGQATLFYPLAIYAAMDSVPQVTHSASKIKIIGSGFRADVKTYCWNGGKSTLGEMLTSTEVSCDVQTSATCGLIEISISNGADHENNATQTKTIPITVLEYPVVTTVQPNISPKNVHSEVYLIGPNLKSTATRMQKCIFSHYRDYDGGDSIGKVLFQEKSKAYFLNTTHVLCLTTYPYPFSVGLSLDGVSHKDNSALFFYLPALRLCPLTTSDLRTCQGDSIQLQSADSEWTHIPDMSFVISDVMRRSLNGIGNDEVTAGIRVVGSLNFPNQLPVLFGNVTQVTSTGGIVTFSGFSLQNASVDTLTLEVYDVNNGTLLPSSVTLRITAGNAFTVANRWNCAFVEKADVSLLDFAGNKIRLDVTGFNSALTSSLLVESEPDTWIRPLYTGSLQASISIVRGSTEVYSKGPPELEVVFNSVMNCHHVELHLENYIDIKVGTLWSIKSQSQGNWRDVDIRNMTVSARDMNGKEVYLTTMSSDVVVRSLTSFQTNKIFITIYECFEDSLPCIADDDDHNLLCDLPMPENIRVGSLYKIQYEIEGYINDTSYSNTCSISSCEDLTKFSLNGVCHKCPEGGVCNGSESKLVVSQPGYWKSAPLTFYKCKFPENCPGEDECSETNTGSMCQSCIENHALHLEYGTCTECSTADAILSIFYMLLLLAILSGFTIIAMLHVYEYQTILIRIALDYGQASAFLVGMHPTLKTFIKDYYYALRYFILDFGSTKSWRCFLGMDNIFIHFIITMLLCPVMSLLVAAIAWAAYSKLRHSKIALDGNDNNRTELDKQLLDINARKLERIQPRQNWIGRDFQDFINANENWVEKVEEVAAADTLSPKYEVGFRNSLITSFCVCFYFLFSAIVHTTIEKFSCSSITRDENSTTDVLWSTPSELCPWNTVLVIMSLVVYVLIVPVGILVTLKTYHNVHGDLQTGFVFSGIVGGYKRRFWVWFASVLLRKAAIIVIATTKIETLTKAFILMWVWAVPFVAHFLIAPFENDVHNAVEGYTLMATFIAINAGLLGADDGAHAVNYDYKSVPSIVILIVNILGWISILWGFCRHYCIREKDNDSRKAREEVDEDFYGDILDENVMQRELEALSQDNFDDDEVVSLEESLQNKFNPDTAPNQCLVMLNNNEARMSYAHGLQQVAIGTTTRLEATDLRNVYQIKEPENRLIIESSHNTISVVGKSTDIDAWCTWLSSAIVSDSEKESQPESLRQNEIYEFHAATPPPRSHFLDNNDDEVAVSVSSNKLKIGSSSILASDIVSVICGTDTIRIMTSSKEKFEIFGADSDVTIWSDFFNTSKKTGLSAALHSNSSESNKFLPVDDL